MQQFTGYLGDTWHFFKARLLPICSILFPVLVPLNLLLILTSSTQNAEQFSLFVLFLQLSLYPIYQSALIVFINSAIKGKAMEVKACYQQAISWWPYMLILYSVYLIAIMIGLTLLLIPGLIVIARFSYVEFCCLLEKKSPWDAIAQSWKATEPHQFELLAGFVFLWCITALPLFWLQQIVAGQLLLQFVLSLTAGIIVAPITIFRFRYYSEFVQKSE